MCFSASASLATLVIGLLGSFAVFQLPKPEDKVIGLFFAFVSLMQGIEYLLWKHPICDTYNRDVSRVGMWLNHHQPIILGTLILNYFPANSNKSLILFLMAIYFSALLPYGFQFHKLPIQQQCTHTDDHMTYSWSMMRGSYALYTLYLSLIVALPLLGFKDKTIAAASVAAGAAAWISTDKFYDRKYFSSLWCFYIVFLPFLYLAARTTSTL